MDTVNRSEFRGFIRFVSLNLQHYVLAFWGLRLRLDPDYPMEWQFLPTLMTDSVLEYRAYTLFAPWCVFLAAALSNVVLEILIVLWTVLAFHRAYFYSSALRFWRQAYIESPNKKRVQIRLAEEIAYEIERLDKAGQDWTSPTIQALIVEGVTLQERIVSGK